MHHLFRDVVIILGASTAFSFPTKVYGGVLDAQYRFDINASLAILGSLLRTGLVILAILAGGGLLALAWMTLLASLPVAALQIWLGKREAHWARIETKFDASRIRSLFSYSIYSFLSYLADIVAIPSGPSSHIGTNRISSRNTLQGSKCIFAAVLSASISSIRRNPRSCPQPPSWHGQSSSNRSNILLWEQSSLAAFPHLFASPSSAGEGLLSLVGWGRAIQMLTGPLVTLCLVGTARRLPEEFG